MCTYCHQNCQYLILGNASRFLNFQPKCECVYCVMGGPTHPIPNKTTN
jgi:hypothetical protein